MGESGHEPCLSYLPDICLEGLGETSENPSLDQDICSSGQDSREVFPECKSSYVLLDHISLVNNKAILIICPPIYITFKECKSLIHNRNLFQGHNTPTYITLLECQNLITKHKFVSNMYTSSYTAFKEL